MILLFMLSPVFVQLTGAHYLQCFDRQEPTAIVVRATYLAGALQSHVASAPADEANSPGDMRFDLSVDKTAA